MRNCNLLLLNLFFCMDEAIKPVNYWALQVQEDFVSGTSACFQLSGLATLTGFTFTRSAQTWGWNQSSNVKVCFTVMWSQLTVSSPKTKWVKRCDWKQIHFITRGERWSTISVNKTETGAEGTLLNESICGNTWKVKRNKFLTLYFLYHRGRGGWLGRGSRCQINHFYWLLPAEGKRFTLLFSADHSP